MPRSPSGTKYPVYRPKTVAMAAMMPECITQNMDQPQRKPTTGAYVSLRKTYTPPVRGNADASSAHASAPNSDRMPDTDQTSSTAQMAGTCSVTSDACTNTAEPRIVPTTSAVACGRRRERASCKSEVSCLKARDLMVCMRLET